ncbi:hypothetical protein [Bacillus haynesii]|uniref:hypothetical protein n=1 Tax=Bacillus haynesii TaxID=1925021 RepID=UPI001F60F53A|nr:hypothetical protein [Bacillus haynesii]MCI4126964.1 hypothetical protein [Bacillus haynesii]
MSNNTFDIFFEEEINNNGTTVKFFAAAITAASIVTIPTPAFTSNQISSESIIKDSDSETKSVNSQLNHSSFTISKKSDSTYINYNITDSSIGIFQFVDDVADLLITTNVPIVRKTNEYLSTPTSIIGKESSVEGGDKVLKDLKSRRNKVENFATSLGVIGGFLILTPSLFGLNLAVTVPPAMILFSLPISMILRKKMRELSNES